MTVLVVTPTYNERHNLERFVGGVHAVMPEASVLVVDDASPDGTGRLADELAARDPRVGVMHRSGKLGLGTAYLAAFGHAIRHGFDNVVQMDADLSHDPRYLRPMLDAIESGADLVLGSRNVEGGGVRGWGVGRHVLSKGGSLYSRAILGVPIRDLTTGYKAWRVPVLAALDLGTVRSEGYSFQIEMTYRAIRRGFHVQEVPIVFVDRFAGQSKMSRRIFFEAVSMVWKLRIDAALGRI
ncbi:MAG: polyprenol monophosphomannose synthase [Deltaproteobacteria bacterium]|nr:polyprenol monophosphomannose synthase [Deltaproteobacteria bacterium]